PPRALPPFPTRRSSDLGLMTGVLRGDIGRDAPSAVAQVLPPLPELGQVVLAEAERDGRVVGGEPAQAAPAHPGLEHFVHPRAVGDRKSTRLNSSHVSTS